MHHQARKRFGQHFLTDVSVIEDIVRHIYPHPDDLMVEIGPGLSALTQPLMRTLEHLHVVEIDRDLAACLRNTHAPERLSVHEIDALEFDFGSLKTGDKPLRIVGNLPYNISSPLLFHLMHFADQVQDQHFMLQKEVVDRMVAQPGSAAYGRLSVMLQYRYQIMHLMDVEPDAFNPPPKVMSAIVRMIPMPASRQRAQDEALFAQVVAQAFSQKRKMLRRSLQGFSLDWDALSVAPTARPEQLTVGDFITLADALASAAA